MQLRKMPEYWAWENMRQRCFNPSCRDFKYYGARGISVCDRWVSFGAFILDMGLRPSRKHSLGRIDNDKGYSPDNCRWETPEQQLTNTRISKVWKVRGAIFASHRAAARHFGVDPSTIRRWAASEEAAP
jgi:hypothetical protein